MRVLQFPSQYRQGETPYDIFKNRMAAVNSLVKGIKGMIENKYNKGLIDTTIGQLEKARSEQEVTDMVDLLNADPGEEIYPGGTAKIEEIAGQFVDTFNVMGNMMKGREGMASPGMPSMGGMPSGMPSGTPPTSETMIPKGDKAQLLNAIMNVPEGQMDFTPILNYMKEHRPKMMGSFSPMEEWVMNQALGQESPKEKLSKDVKLATEYWEYSKEPEKARITNEVEFAREDPEGYRNFLQQKEALDITTKEKDTQMYIGMYNRKEISRDELMKLLGGYVAPEKLSDFEKKWNMFIKIYEDNNMEIPLNNALKILDAYVAPEEEEKLETPTYSTAESIEKGFMERVENVQDFGNELNRLKGLNIDTKTFETKEYFPKLMKKKYDEAISVIEYCKWGISNKPSEADIKKGATQEVDTEGLNYKETYQEWYEKAKNYDQEYFNVTGKRLLEEDSELKKEEKTDKTLELAKEMVAEKKSLEDLDFDKIKAMGIDIEELKKAYMKLYLNKR